MGRAITFVVILFICVSTASAKKTSADKNLRICNNETAPLLYDELHTKIFNTNEGLTSREFVNVTYPGRKITCIRAINQGTDSSAAGIASLRSGGLGQPEASIHLQGAFMRGYSFRVIVNGEAGEPLPTTPSSGAQTPPTTSKPHSHRELCFCTQTCQSNIFDGRIFVPNIILN